MRKGFEHGPKRRIVNIVKNKLRRKKSLQSIEHIMGNKVPHLGVSI